MSVVWICVCMLRWRILLNGCVLDVINVSHHTFTIWSTVCPDVILLYLEWGVHTDSYSLWFSCWPPPSPSPPHYRCALNVIIGDISHQRCKIFLPLRFQWLRPWQSVSINFLSIFEVVRVDWLIACLNVFTQITRASYCWLEIVPDFLHSMRCSIWGVLFSVGWCYF